MLSPLKHLNHFVTTKAP